MHQRVFFFLAIQSEAYYSEHVKWTLKNQYVTATNRRREMNNATIITFCNKENSQIGTA